MIKINAVQNTSLYDIHVIDDQGNVLFQVNAGRIYSPPHPIQVGEEGYPFVEIRYQDAALTDWKVSVSEPDGVRIQAKGKRETTFSRTGEVKMRVGYLGLSLYAFERRSMD
jgi:hypothetical protein